MSELDIDRLKAGYVPDLSADIIDEAIATIKHAATHLSEDEIYHHSRPLMVAYIALKEAKKKIIDQ